MQDAAETVGTDGQETAVVVAENPVVERAAGAVDRLAHGDMSLQAWMDLWWGLGWPITKALLLIVAVMIAAVWAARLTSRALRRARVEETLARFFGHIARWAVFLLGGLAVLNTFGVNTTSFAAAIAAVGFAIGMALSNTLSHFASGVMLMVFRPFKVGDVVKAAGVTGIIDEIGLFTTTFDTFQKERVIVPNGKLYGDIIQNVTYHPVRRHDINIGTAYSADIDATRHLLQAVVAGCEGVLKDPAPQVYLDGLGADSVNWQLRVWGKGADLWPMRERLIRDVKRALDEAGIGIPFPQRELHLDRPLEVRLLDRRED